MSDLSNMYNTTLREETLVRVSCGRCGWIRDYVPLEVRPDKCPACGVQSYRPLIDAAFEEREERDNFIALLAAAQLALANQAGFSSPDVDKLINQIGAFLHELDASA